MKVAVLGRSEILYEIVEDLLQNGHELTSIVSPMEAPERSRTAEDFRALSETHGIPFSSGLAMNELIEFLKVGEPDIGVSVNYPVVISSDVIESLPLGILNVHGGDLPRYRGNACQAWAILNGEDRIGLCVHRMEGGKLVSGEIISRDYFPVDVSTSITSVHEWITARSPALVLEARTSPDDDPSFPFEKQTESGKLPLRCFPRKPEDSRIDWSVPALEVVRLLKAYSRPYRGAYCFFEDVEVTIWDADIINFPHEFLAVPGQVMEIGQDEIVVACGDGAIRLTEGEEDGVASKKETCVRSIRQRFCS